MAKANSSRRSGKRILIIIGAGVLLVLIPLCYYLCFSFLVWLSFQKQHQADAQMIANFQKHQNDFERLRQMVLEDKGLIRVDDDWTEPHDPQTIGIKPERIAQYRSLFKQVGIPRGFSSAADRKDIEFIDTTKGMLDHGSFKGYVYLKSRPKKLLDNLDTLESQKMPDGVGKKWIQGYRLIEGNWFLYYDSI
jgi:hypothetical protein